MKTARMLLAVEDGGRWLVVRVHSFVTPDGKRWDAHNGWAGEVSVAEIVKNQDDEAEDNELEDEVIQFSIALSGRDNAL